ncbi:hypothetical protein PGB90_009371 [Kerria lacca]
MKLNCLPLFPSYLVCFLIFQLRHYIFTYLNMLTDEDILLPTVVFLYVQATSKKKKKNNNNNKKVNKK